MMLSPRFPLRCVLARVIAGAFSAAALVAGASEFSVSPITVELKPGVASETVTVTNHANTRLRVNVKLMEWTQDEHGADVYRDSGDIVYFPRQMTLEADSKRLVRVGAKALAPATERAYRLFIEEQPEPAAEGSRAQVAFYFRFSLPIFLPPPEPKAQAEVTDPALQKGKLAFTIRNPGNRHVRMLRILVVDDHGHQQEVPGWYLLAGRQKTYSATIAPEVCRQAKTLTIRVEGEDAKTERTVNVDAARCL
jgi:fimbrial chaperone protein